MKSVKTTTIILGLIVLGLVGYYFYTSMQELANQEEYQFTEGEEIETSPEETELEAEVESQESQEIQAEAELTELEAMDF